jgi:hypothetical protein
MPIVRDDFGVEGRAVGRAKILVDGDVVIFAGAICGIGPAIALGGGALGAGAGMYGCFSPPVSETGGAFLGEDEGVRIPFDSPII